MLYLHQFWLQVMIKFSPASFFFTWKFWSFVYLLLCPANHVPNSIVTVLRPKRTIGFSGEAMSFISCFPMGRLPLSGSLNGFVQSDLLLRLFLDLVAHFITATVGAQMPLFLVGTDKALHSKTLSNFNCRSKKQNVYLAKASLSSFLASSNLCSPF